MNQCDTVTHYNIVASLLTLFKYVTVYQAQPTAEIVVFKQFVISLISSNYKLMQQ